MSTPPFNPQPCTTSAGGASVDVESNLICELDADGNLVGTALAVYTYDGSGNPVGPPTFVDPVTGDPYVVTTGTLQACPENDAVRTLTAQARQITNATPWTPGADVSGTLTSLTLTGTSGLWDMVDASGTAVTGLPSGLSLTWEVEDGDILTGPQSVTPQAAATVVANWTER